MPQGLGSFSVTRMLICCLFNVVANLIYSFSRPGKSLKQARSLKVLVLALTYLVPLDHLACVVAACCCHTARLSEKVFFFNKRTDS